MNRAEAKDAIYSFGSGAVQSAFTKQGMGPATLRFGRIPGDEPPQGSWWARLSIQTVDEEQETLRIETRRFMTTGIAYVQLFAPNTDKKADSILDLIAEDVRNAYRIPLPDSNLEFTGAKIDDNVTPEPAWLPLLIRAQFSYRQFL